MLDSKSFIKAKNSSKWENKLEQNSFSLTLADIDVPIYKPFHEKFIQKMINVNNFTYKQRSQQYFSSVINWQKKHYIVQNNIQIHDEDVIASPSVCNLYACSILAFTQPQDYILIITPTYSFYKDSIITGKRRLAYSQMKLKKIQTSKNLIYQYQLDLEDLKNKMHLLKPKLLTFCNPHNPGGKIFTRQQINFIINQAKKLNCIIFSDQILADFSIFSQLNHKQKFYSLINSDYQNIVIGNSIGKSFNCSSIQGGYGLAKCKEVRQKLTTISLKMFKLLTNQIAQIMTSIVYSQSGQKWLKQINVLVAKNFCYFIKKTQNTKLKIVNLQSTYLLAICFENYLSLKVNAKQIKKKLIQKKIYLVSMENYFEPTNNCTFYRVSIAVDSQFFMKFTQNLLETLHQIDKNNQIFPKI